MQVTIQCRGFPRSAALIEYVQRRVGFTLARAVDRLRRVEVRLSDINGPRGGVDKRCLIEARLDSLPAIVIEEVQPDLYRAIDRAAGRAGRTVMRRLALQGSRRRQAAARPGS